MPDVRTVPGPGGRHYIHPDTGELFPGVTTVLGVVDKPAIPRWAARTAAEFAVDHRDAWDDLDADAAIALIKGAPWRKRDAAGTVGTNAHSYAHARLMEGISPDPLSHSEELVDEVLAALNPVPLFNEATVFGDGYAGTFDGLWSVAGVPTIIDWKSGTGIYPEVALQVNAYAMAPNVWHPGRATLVSMPVPLKAYAIHVPASGPYAIHPIALGATHRAAFRAALNLWTWRTHHADLALGQPYQIRTGRKVKQ